MNEKKLYRILQVALAIILCSFAVSGFTVYKTYALHSKFDAKTQENDVKINNEYTILSTEDLSKAYLSGDTSKLSVDDQQTIDNADKVLKEIIKDDMSDFEKEKAVYDWMVSNITQNYGTSTVIANTTVTYDQPSGVLQTHEAVTVGCATTFRLFMEMLDIPCHVVHDVDDSDCWNVVQIDNEWYAVNISSDLGSLSYTNFNNNDEILESNNTRWDHDAFPACTSLKYNLSYMNLINESDVYGIAKDFAKELKEDHKQFAIQFDHTLTEEESTILYYLKDTIENTLNGEDPSNVYYFSYNTLANDQGTLFLYSLTSYASDYTDDPESSVDEKTQAKITKAIDQAFGDLPVQEYSEDDYSYGG